MTSWFYVDPAATSILGLESSPLWPWLPPHPTIESQCWRNWTDPFVNQQKSCSKHNGKSLLNKNWQGVLFRLKAWTKYANLEQLAIVFRLLQHCAKPTLFQWLGHCQKKHDDVCENSQTKLAWQVKNSCQDIRLCTTTKCFIWSLDVSCFLDFSWWHLGWCKNWCFTGKIVISAWKKKKVNSQERHMLQSDVFPKQGPRDSALVAEACHLAKPHGANVHLRDNDEDEECHLSQFYSLPFTFRINIKMIVMFTIHFDYPNPYPYQCCCHHHGEYSPISPGFVYAPTDVFPPAFYAMILPGFCHTGNFLSFEPCSR